MYYYDYYEKAIEGATDQSTRSRAAMSGLSADAAGVGPPLPPDYYQPGQPGFVGPTQPGVGRWFSVENIRGVLDPLTQAAQIYSTIKTEPYRRQLELQQARIAAQQAAAEAAARQAAAPTGISKWTWAYIAVAGVVILGGAYFLGKKK